LVKVGRNKMRLFFFVSVESVSSDNIRGRRRVAGCRSPCRSASSSSNFSPKCFISDKLARNVSFSKSSDKLWPSRRWSSSSFSQGIANQIDNIGPHHPTSVYRDRAVRRPRDVSTASQVPNKICSSVFKSLGHARNDKTVCFFFFFSSPTTTTSSSTIVVF